MRVVKPAAMEYGTRIAALSASRGQAAPAWGRAARRCVRALTGTAALPTQNLLLFLVEAVFYFTVMIGFLHFRRRLGLGVFLTALGVMHFLETYLAAVFYVQVPFGVVSPGSSIMFAGKLMLILLLYIKEDAEVVRQPIYGLFLGNLLTISLALLLQFHTMAGLGGGGDTGFLKEIGWLMLWGTTLLYVDSIGIILLYERLGRLLPRSASLRFFIAGALMLTFDQIGFFSALHLFLDLPLEAFWGGWHAKMLAVALYSVIFFFYRRLRDVREGHAASARPLSDIFGDLTFRERYESLLARSGRDALTGVFDRARMEIDAPAMIRTGLQSGGEIGMVIFDADHFKGVNDRFGHLEGDKVLKALADLVQSSMRAEDRLYRFGGEEFIILLPGLGPQAALAVAERLRRKVASTLATPDGMPVTISCGVASGPLDGETFSEMLARADERLYSAKHEGRNRVCGHAA